MLNELQHLRPLNAGDRNRTGTVSLQQDFKSCASASSATPAFSICTASYIQRLSLTSYLKMPSYRTIHNGQRWIRTTEASCSRFTVCPLWPLGNLPILVSTNVLTRIDYNISFFIVQDKILYFLHFLE